MNKKEFANIVLVLIVVVIIGVAGYFFFAKKSEPTTSSNQNQIPNQSISTLNNSESVCRYVDRDTKQRVVEGTTISFTKCNNYECSARDGGENWDVTYRCPGPPQFPMGESYLLQVNKSTGDIKVTAVSN